MKRFVLLITALLICGIAVADTINLTWKVDDTTYSQSTCEYGGNLIVPTEPTKYGYTFNGWAPYLQIEYLQSTGTQYIDTGYKFDDNIKVLFKANWQNLKSILFGNRTDSIVTDQYLTEGTIVLNGDWSRWSGISLNTDYTIEIQFYMGNAYAKINDNLIASNNNNKTNKDELYLFLSKYTGSSLYQYMKIYYFKLYQNDVLVRDFIPVIDANGVACMLDKVTNSFFYNSGSGQFVAGPTINQ